MPRLIHVTVFCLFLPAAAAAGNYQYTKIDFPNATKTVVSGVNARGDLVGSYVDSKGATHGFFWRKGKFTSIDVPEASLTEARGINARGDITGRILDSAGHEHGFLLKEGEFTQIDYPKAATTEALGVNNAADVTGRYFNPAGAESGFLFREGTFYRVRIIDSCGTEVWMTQDDGKASVGQFCGPTDRKIHGYLRPTPDHFVNIDFTEAACTSAHWISQKDVIAGSYGLTADDCAASHFHGFVLQQGQFASVDFPTSNFTDVQSVNDYGVVAGSFMGNDGVVHGFEATPK